MFFNTNFQIIVILLDLNYHYYIIVANKDYHIFSTIVPNNTRIHVIERSKNTDYQHCFSMPCLFVLSFQTDHRSKNKLRLKQPKIKNNEPRQNVLVLIKKNV